MKLKIAVTGTGSLIGQAIIKSIKLSSLADKIEILGLDYFKDTVGAQWCNQNEILPDILREGYEEDWKNSIFNYILKHEIRVLFIGVDFELTWFAKYKEEFEEKTSCIICVSNEEVISIANDKYLTYQFLKNNNLYHPKSFLPETFKDSDLEFPLILKPRIGARSRDVFVVDNKSDLLKKIELVNKPVIQELIGDIFSEYTCGIIFIDGKLKASIALKRTLKEGNTNKSSYRHDTPIQIYDYIKQVADHLKPFGACNFQMRLDSNGIPKIFEINPRHSGTTYMRSLFGFNEVEFIIQYLIFGIELKFELIEGDAIRYFDECLIKNY
jgi:carbamoyl-phosphate synthase large subunit